MRRLHYPEPPIRYQGHSALVFAPEWQIRSALTLAGHDRGELSLSPRRVGFTGMRVLVDCPNVTSVRLVTKAFPWGPAAVVGALAALLVYLTSPAPLTWRNPFPALILVILVSAALKQSRERWVEIAYGTDAKTMARAFFRMQGGLFRSGNAATRRLCEEIRDQVLLSAGER